MQKFAARIIFLAISAGVPSWAAWAQAVPALSATVNLMASQPTAVLMVGKASQATPQAVPDASVRPTAAVMATGSAQATAPVMETHSAQAIAHVAWAPTSVTRVQDPVDIINSVREFLHGLAARHEGQAWIAVDAPRLGNQASCTDLRPHLPGKQTLRSRMTVTVHCLAPIPWVVHVQASLSLDGGYYVARRSIQAGNTVSRDDLVLREGDLLRVPEDAVLEPESAIGFIASQRIPAGTLVKSRMLRAPGSVERGQMVRTEVRGPGFVVNGEGQALESGAPGTRIQIKARSGQIITGVVLDAHTVRVMI